MVNLKELMLKKETMRLKEISAIKGANNKALFFLKEQDMYIQKMNDDTFIETYTGDIIFKIGRDQFLMVYVIFLINNEIYRTFFLPGEKDDKKLLDTYLNAYECYIITRQNERELSYIKFKKDIVTLRSYSQIELFKELNKENKEKIQKWYNGFTSESFLKEVRKYEKGLENNHIILA